MKSRLDKSAAQILGLRDLCELETRFVFSYLTPQIPTNPSLLRGMVGFYTLQGVAPWEGDTAVAFCICLQCFEASLHTWATMGHSV